MHVTKHPTRVVISWRSKCIARACLSAAWISLLAWGIAAGLAADSPIPSPQTATLAPAPHDAGKSSRAARRHRAPGSRQRSRNGPLPPPWIVEGEPSQGSGPLWARSAGDVNGDGCSDVLLFRSGSGTNPGVVLAYYGSTNGLSPTPNCRLLAPQSTNGEGFGREAASAGDVNNDGYDDVLVRGVGTNSDYLYLFYGSSTGLQAHASWIFKCPHQSLGEVDNIGSAGDVNGDGCADIYITTHLNSPGRGGRGSVLVFYGGTNGLHDAPDRRFDFESPNTTFNICAACAGDVNNDGYDDFIVGDKDWSGSEERQGRVLVYYGSRDGLPAEPNWTATFGPEMHRSEGSAARQLFGTAVASAGDVDRDGFDDVLVGAPFAGIDDICEGLVFVYHGSASGLERQPRRVLQGSQAHAMLGANLDRGGDVNGDGFADVLVGAEQVTAEMLNQGAVALFLGSKQGLAGSPQWTRKGADNHARLGENCCFAGDVNGDGCDDVLVAEAHFKRGDQVVGRVRLFYGSPQGLTGSSDWRMKKPFLAAMQQFHDRTPLVWKWSGAVALAGLTALLFLAWRRALAQLRAHERQQARALERERIARDMHDHLGASLSEIALRSDLAKTATSSPQKMEMNLDRISRSARDALGGMNDLLNTLRSGSQPLEDFAQALVDSAQRLLEPTAIRLVVDYPDSLPELQLDADLRSHLMLVTREAVRNVVQHARAASVTLRLEVQDSTLRLSVGDDGVGFEPARSRQTPAASTFRNNGFGLQNLRARAESLGGLIEVTSNPGKGTTLALELPLDGQRPPPPTQ